MRLYVSELLVCSKAVGDFMFVFLDFLAILSSSWSSLLRCFVSFNAPRCVSDHQYIVTDQTFLALKIQPQRASDKRWITFQSGKPNMNHCWFNINVDKTDSYYLFQSVLTLIKVMILTESIPVAHVCPIQRESTVQLTSASTLVNQRSNFPIKDKLFPVSLRVCSRSRLSSGRNTSASRATSRWGERHAAC